VRLSQQNGHYRKGFRRGILDWVRKSSQNEATPTEIVAKRAELKSYLRQAFLRRWMSQICTMIRNAAKRISQNEPAWL
jgi:hypothetical protein